MLTSTMFVDICSWKQITKKPPNVYIKDMVSKNLKYALIDTYYSTDFKLYSWRNYIISNI